MQPRNPKQRAVFLDRDGVINHVVMRDGKPRTPSRTEDFRLIEGIEAAVGRLREAGFAIVVVTNQPDVARGWISRAAVDEMNSIVVNALKVDALKACFHLEHDACECRKPRPGMLAAAASELGIDLRRSIMVGDRYTDIEAGRRAGCLTVLIGEAGFGDEVVEPDLRASSLVDAVDWILKS